MPQQPQPWVNSAMSPQAAYVGCQPMFIPAGAQASPGGTMMYQPQHPVQPVPSLQLSYKCNFLEQLQGMYEIETPEGPDRINVLMPTWKNQAANPGMGSSGCTIVRRVAADGEALADQMILEEANRFILASIDQEVEAYMPKGVDMKNGLSWTTLDGATQFWSRVGQVTFNFVSPESLNRSVPSLNRTFSNTSMSSVTSTFSQSSPEMLPQLQLNHSYSHQSEASSSDSYTSYDGRDGYEDQYDPQEQMLFDSIKRYCQGRPSLIKRVVHWGLSRDTEPTPIKMNPEIIRKLSKGRIWVCVDKMLPVNSGSSTPGAEGNQQPELESLDDLKGAYQQDESGYYIQPKPEANQPGTQHRIRKGENGYWIIEELNPETERWSPRTLEQQGGRWWDNATSKKIRIKLVTLENILDRLGGDYHDGNIEKQMEFLFLSCNQKKLNTKLKKRNLKHNIANLKVKLEKQHCLSFAVRVANIADSIAKEYGVHPN